MAQKLLNKRRKRSLKRKFSHRPKMVSNLLKERAQKDKVRDLHFRKNQRKRDLQLTNRLPILSSRMVPALKSRRTLFFLEVT